MRTHLFRLGLTILMAAPLTCAANLKLILKGTGVIRGGSATSEAGYQTQQGPAMDAHFIKQASGNNSAARVPSAFVPRPSAAAITGPGANFSGFNGMTHLDQRLAGGGNQFSLEPPDQGLSIGNGFVVEAVNLAVSVYSTSGTPLGIAALNGFLGLKPAIDRSSTPPVYGPFTSDPRVYYDAPTGHWFLSVLEIDTDPSTGALLGHSAIYLAVSQSSDPTGIWNIYSFDTTDNGNPGCPCLGDQPLIGADLNGFYVTTNEFSILGPEFNGAQIYAISKTALENNTSPVAIHIPGGPLAENISYSVQPATTPPNGTYESANGGTEYFMSALDFTGTLDNRVAVWALTNTSSLNTASPSLTLSKVVIPSEVYGLAPASQQKPGPLPLADLLKQKNNPLGVTSNEHLELIDSDDDRMQQAVFAAGSLWTSLGTVVKPPNGPARAGAAWFIVTPSWSGGALTATVTKQGYLAANQESVTYPSIGVNAAGKGIMTFTLVGPDYYPSAAYATIDSVNGVGAIQIAANGAVPDDGFTGYGAFGGRVARWGDYTAAVADSDGSIWIAAEYIPGGPRTILANWGTFVGRIVP
ncbi:MAG TPA: hypothetical protein VK776_20650 [Bryobacteraceae bacterium]|nr:hypothetical protein [Bryobacteraceae bacterium]